LGVFVYLALQGSMDETVTASGEVHPKDYAIVFSTAPGILQELLVNEGDEVRAGDAVARVVFIDEQMAMDQHGWEHREVHSSDGGRVIATTALQHGDRLVAGTPLVKLALSNEREVCIFATNDAIERITLGQEVRMRVRSNPVHPKPTAGGKVVFVARDKDLIAGAIAENSVCRIRAVVEESEYELPFGSQIDLQIVLSRRRIWELILSKFQR